MGSMIRASNLTISYKDKTILNSISFDIKNNGIFALMGKNGSGKTTLLYTIAGIIPNFIEGEVKGELEVFGKNPGNFKNKFFIFQDVEDSFIYPSVKEEVSSYKNGEEELKHVGLESKIDSDIFSLSHGEKHRLALSLAFASNAKLLLFDESFSSLDFDSIKKIIPLLKEMSKKSVVLFSTHSSQLAYEIADEIFILDNASLLIGKELLREANKFGLKNVCSDKIYGF